MPGPSPPSPTAAGRFWRPGTPCASAPASKAIAVALGREFGRNPCPPRRAAQAGRNLPRPAGRIRLPCSPNAAASGAGTSTPSSSSMPGRAVTGVRPRCGRCIGSRREADRTPGQTPAQGLEPERRQDMPAPPQTRRGARPRSATGSPTGRPRILPASVGRVQRNRGRAQGGAEGLRRVPGTGGRKVRHGRRKGEPDPQEVEEPENGPVAVTVNSRS